METIRKYANLKIKDRSMESAMEQIDYPHGLKK